MRRREFLGTLGGNVICWPLLARAQQQSGMRRIGVLLPGRDSDPEYQARFLAFNEALKEHGWIIGRNVQIDQRWAAGDPDRIKAYAKELVEITPDVIFANGTGPTAALHKLNRPIPIVFAVVSDPLGDGFVDNLAHPGGNITGFSTFDPEIGGKWLQLLREISPGTTRVALLFNPKTAPGGGSFFLRPIVEAAARSFGIEVIAAPAQTRTEIETAIATLGRASNGALLVMPDTFTIANREVIIGMVNKHRLPAIYPFRVFAEAGGLVVYGVDVIDLNRRAASYVHRILKGEKPADLPVQTPTKFELLINLKAAKVIGLEMPGTLLARADEVID